MKAQEECVALQAARLEFVKKASKGGKILRPLTLGLIILSLR